jgi:hypothetical protein
MMAKYSGYLSPHLSLIKRLLSEGWTTKRIAEHLYNEHGARSQYAEHPWYMDKASQISSFAGIIHTCIKSKGKPKPQAIDWWTPEREEMAIRQERGEA